jgi:uncharacterized protein (TIGR00369 family)
MSNRKTPDKGPSPRQHNLCFGCGPNNPDSMRLEFTYDEAGGRVACEVNLGDRYTGPPGHCHGGIIATMLDEIMSKLNKLHGVTAVTSEITVKYLRPVPLHTRLKLEAHEVRVEGRRRFREGKIFNSKGETLARGQGTFITVNPERIFPKSV